MEGAMVSVIELRQQHRLIICSACMIEQNLVDL